MLPVFYYLLFFLKTITETPAITHNAQTTDTTIITSFLELVFFSASEEDVSSCSKDDTLSVC